MRDRVGIVACATFREAVRDRVLLTVVLFAVAMVLGSRVLAVVSDEMTLKVVQDLSLSGVSILAMLLAMLVGAGSLAREVERRTVYTVLSRDCGRGEFVVGKYVGLVGVTWLCVLGAGVFVALWVMVWGGSVGAPLVAAIVGVLLEVLVLTSVALFLGALSAPAIASVGTLAFYVVAHATEALRDLTAGDRDPGFREGFRILYLVVPNLENVNFLNLTTVERPVPWGDVGLGALSTLCWSAAFLAAAALLFRRRQF